MDALFTIGHSNHSSDQLLALLQQHEITALADVRSQPYSSHCPQFTQDALKGYLQLHGILYVYLGKYLGARSENRECYRQGRVQFDLLAKDPMFAQGLGRLRQGMEKYQIALMCAEKDPLDCHRSILVARRMHESGTRIQHIHADGSLEPHWELESRMIHLHNMSEADMVSSRAEVLDNAYRLQEKRIAYQNSGR